MKNNWKMLMTLIVLIAAGAIGVGAQWLDSRPRCGGLEAACPGRVRTARRALRINPGSPNPESHPGTEY